MKKIKKEIYLLPSILWMMGIFFFSHQPAELSNENNFFIADILRTCDLELFTSMDYDILNLLIRKAAHITEYFILFMLLYFAIKKLSQYRDRILKDSILRASISTILYACTDEFHQLFIQGRAGRIQDVLIDSIGIVVGILAIWLCSKIRKIITYNKEKE